MYLVFFGSLLFSVLVYHFVDATSSEEDDRSEILKWMSFMLSRSGVYLTLVSFIVINFCITKYKNKYERSLRPTNGLTDTEDFSGLGRASFSDDDTESIKARLREAEITVAALKAELEETQKTKVSLENSLEELEKDKSFSDDELMKTRVQKALELETQKKENATLERQLNRVKVENESLARQIEVLQREAKISESALRDQQNLNTRLEATRSELDTMKAQLKGIKIERDTAVRLASEQIYKMRANGSTQRREVIEQMIDMELKRMREEEEMKDRMADRTLSGTEFTIQNEPDVTLSSVPEMQSVDKHAVGDAPIGCSCPEDTYNITGDTSSYSYVDRTITTSDDCTDDDTENAHLVTGSSAFRAFLRTTYG